MRVTDTSDVWWKTAVVYCLDVGTFLDWDGDGVGDFEGLSHRLDYVSSLGVTCVWLMPFYPSPRRDHGYDIADFYGVDPRFGHLGDFVEVVRAAKDRGIRVIVDLVINHTSEKHPWFTSARRSPASPYRDFYLWRDEPPADQEENMFPDVEDGTWAFDEQAGQYYRHSFYREQPDLNIAHPDLREEIAKVLAFWLELGVDGFRIDSAPHVISAGAGDDDPDREHEMLRELRASVVRRKGSALLLGEVNLPYDEQQEFFGVEGGTELSMQFDFPANQAMFLSLARQDARPLARMLASRPPVDRTSQWAVFIRNHDELNLDQLSDAEREEVLDAFAPEESQRIHGRGITRRLPAMLEGDPRRVRMVYSLLFSLPGTPVLYYGEEIGMSEHADVAGRSAVRTPMQWSTERNGGFSDVAPSRLFAPVVEGGASPEHVNVTDQLHDEGSLLRFVSLLAQRYRTMPEIGWGELRILEHEHDCVLAHAVRNEDAELVALHNFAHDGRVVHLELGEREPGTTVVDVLTGQSHACGPGGRLEVALDGYGYQWLRVLGPGERRLP
ncbi:alpha-amylase family protein [Nocardioides massiliensis]|uniref:Alpha-amylase n=1 Tax=Nocardioides massiliensis TaxID=1325935 RepID=A0ABT9NK27_9ACTN|nr:alpha-amylase family protein [Nocardioides massiliensis]MDP9820205.1 trehalose synthase [Nocardioides massiliensis]